MHYSHISTWRLRMFYAVSFTILHLFTRVVCPPKPMMHIAYSLCFHEVYEFPLCPQNFKISPIFVQFMFFFLIYIFVLPPYFDHDAFTHLALHVLYTLYYY